MPGVIRRLSRPLTLVIFALVLTALGTYASIAPADDTMRLNRVRQAGDVAAKQAGMMLQADVAVACLIAESFPETGQNQSALLEPVVMTFVRNNPTVSNVVIINSTGQVVIDILHHDPPVQNGSANMPSHVTPGKWRDIDHDGTGGMQSILVRGGKVGVVDAYFGVLQTERGVSPRSIYVLNAAHVMPLSSMGLGQTWLVGDDGIVLARTGMQDATLDAERLGQQWRSMRAGGEVSGALTMAVGGHDHLVFYRQLDGWPATLVIDAGAVNGGDPELGISPFVRSGIALCLVLAAGAVGACAFTQFRSHATGAGFAAGNRRGVPMRQLAGKIAHDFNNLLMVLTEDADKAGVGSGDNAPGRRRYLMHEAKKRGLLLTQTLLAYSERSLLHESVVDLSVILEHQHAAYSEVLLPAQVLLMVLPKPEAFSASVRVDPCALNACLLNMLHHIVAVVSFNATIQIDLRGADRSGMVVLTMSDAHAPDGLPPTVGEVEGMVEFQPDLPDRRMGLALPAAAGFARQSGGEIEVSGGGKFLRISLHLPVRLGASADNAAAPSLLSNARRDIGLLPKRTAAHRGRPMRVLVADDSILVRHSVVRWLGSDGYIVMTADSVAQAAALLADNIDILITDIVFGDVEDGFALARKAREMDPLLPLVFMSGFMSARQPLPVADDELASFVRKPIGGEELRAVVEGLLALRETRRL